MEKRYTDIDENAPVHILPYEVMRDLSRVLDGGDAWVELAGYMPDITIQDVDGCRQYSTYHRGSPSEYLLRIWASKGYSILSLYNLFAIARMVRCMRIMRHLGTDGIVGILILTFSSFCFPRTRPPPSIAFKSATSNFSDENILGKGGYGVVYVGEWKHTKIAVKRFMASGNKCGQGSIQRERLRQSLQELRTLAKFRHDNILPLYAFSLDGPEPCLVYQYMSNGSLEDRLLCRRGTAPLSWPQKKEIADGTARGLHFLHSIGSVPIIHGDVKSANILLDRHLEPKLGDFGLSRDGKVEADADEKSPLIASHVKGTLAYLPPEFITNRILSTKLDVYSFGIVLLEICTGMNNFPIICTHINTYFTRISSGMRAFMDSRVPPNLLDYCVANRDSRKGASNRTEWIESLMDKRTPSVEKQGLFLSAPPQENK
ncbi:unnamed protein product [Nippostrongylus brasiliensis]|uniref:non-specific serine/threonine protein kinase n=1 Tax=Nippostrongylus brasiliensis TaxID=27835 RepID=A0A0N4YAS4_NIPBR|nr:unnamed protein product [Nippostrongylus brasiliensis]